jgi:hypothetical protein
MKLSTHFVKLSDKFLGLLVILFFSSAIFGLFFHSVYAYYSLILLLLFSFFFLFFLIFKMFVRLWRSGQASLVVSIVATLIFGIFIGLYSFKGGCFMDPGCRQSESSKMYEVVSLSLLFLSLVLFLYSCVIYRFLEKNENFPR